MLLCAHASLDMLLLSMQSHPHCHRGYLVAWDVEKPVWWRAFRNILQQQPQECGLLVTEAPFNLPSIQASTMQVTRALPDALKSTRLEGVHKGHSGLQTVPCIAGMAQAGRLR